MAEVSFIVLDPGVRRRVALVLQRLGGALPFWFAGGLLSLPLLAMLAIGSGGGWRG